MGNEMNESGQALLLLGELRGQVRELVHSVNNTAQMVAALAEKVNATAGLPDRVAAIKDEMDDINQRVRSLEDKESRRTGAVGLGAWLVKVVPILLSVAAGAGFMEIIR